MVMNTFDLHGAERLLKPALSLRSHVCFQSIISYRTHLWRTWCFTIFVFVSGNVFFLNGSELESSQSTLLEFHFHSSFSPGTLSGINWQPVYFTNKNNLETDLLFIAKPSPGPCPSPGSSHSFLWYPSGESFHARDEDRPSSLGCGE